MINPSERVKQDLRKVTSEDRLSVFYPWLNTDEKQDLISHYIEDGTIENEQQLVVKILDEFTKR